MPRQDVPYGGAICRLKERIAELFDLVGQKLHSINGVEGDGQGDVKILSDDPAVVITNDAAQNEIKIGLDSSELPSAAVQSVNGETGAVVLDATDIKTTNNVPIQTKIVALENATQTALNNINTEAQNRQNADSALQTNINQVQAGMPAAAAAAVAADPTVAQLVAADADNVKLTGNQRITGIKEAPTQNTGSYSLQIANSLKLRNEIANLAVMQTGNQTKTGNLLMYNNLNKRLIADWSALPASNVAIAYNFGYDDASNRINVTQVYSGTDGGVQQELILYDHDSTSNVRLIFGFRGTTKKAFLGLRDSSGITHIIYQEP